MSRGAAVPLPFPWQLLCQGSWRDPGPAIGAQAQILGSAATHLSFSCWLNDAHPLCPQSLCLCHMWQKHFSCSPLVPEPSPGNSKEELKTKGQKERDKVESRAGSRSSRAKPNLGVTPQSHRPALTQKWLGASSKGQANRTALGVQQPRHCVLASCRASTQDRCGQGPLADTRLRRISQGMSHDPAPLVGG